MDQGMNRQGGSQGWELDKLGVPIGVKGIATFQKGLALGLCSQLKLTGFHSYIYFLDKNINSDH